MILSLSLLIEDELEKSSCGEEVAGSPGEHSEAVCDSSNQGVTKAGLRHRVDSNGHSLHSSSAEQIFPSQKGVCGFHLGHLRGPISPL